jgi:hypothetical protein
MGEQKLKVIAGIGLMKKAQRSSNRSIFTLFRSKSHLIFLESRFSVLKVVTDMNINWLQLYQQFYKDLILRQILNEIQ